MPGGKDVGGNIRELEHANKSKPKGKRRSHKQIQAIAYSQAREAGAKIPEKKTGKGQDREYVMAHNPMPRGKR